MVLLYATGIEAVTEVNSALGLAKLALLVSLIHLCYLLRVSCYKTSFCRTGGNLNMHVVLTGEK